MGFPHLERLQVSEVRWYATAPQNRSDMVHFNMVYFDILLFSGPLSEALPAVIRGTGEHLPPGGAHSFSFPSQ